MAERRSLPSRRLILIAPAALPLLPGLARAAEPPAAVDHAALAAAAVFAMSV